MSISNVDALLASIEHDIQTVTPDAHVIAQQLVASKKRVREKVDGHWRTVTKKTQSETEIAFGITGITPDLTIAGGSTLVITMQDPEWALLDSGFFGADSDHGQLDALEVNYEDGSRRWWRLHQLSPQSDHTITLTFLPYIVTELMLKKGPIKVNRAKRTRAEFLKSLCAKIGDPSGPVEFYSKQLDVKQAIGGTTDTKSSSKAPAGKAAKSTGIGGNRKQLKCKGATLTSHQAELCNTILQVGEKLSAPKNALIAAIYAAMGESNISDTVSGGVFQTTGVPSAYSGGHDTAAQAHGWFTGGTSFSSGGGIALANQGVAPWQIANMVEMNAAWLYHKQDSYGHEWPGGKEQGLQEAEAIVSGGGGALGSTVEITQPYYFQVNANEDYWSAMNRLAQEVGWELIVDGNRIYYDSDTTLIRQKVAAVITRDGPETLAWSYDWVNRQKATNFSVQVLCEPFEFHAGEVLQVEKFGAASLGSTAGLPGRWLISEISRSAGDLFSTFTLVQPTAPKNEPAPQTVSKTIKGGSGAPIGTVSSETPKTARAAYAAAKWLSDRHLTYTQAVRQLIKNVPSNVPMFDCSSSVSWLLLAAGFPLPSGLSWGNWAPVSGEFIPGQAGLQAGPGKEMTIYANAGHVFIRIHPQGLPDMQGNTVNPFGHGFGFFSWTAAGCGSDGGPTPSGFTLSHYPGT